MTPVLDDRDAFHAMKLLRRSGWPCERVAKLFRTSATAVEKTLARPPRVELVPLVSADERPVQRRPEAARA